jgi:hypothetical protein
MLGKGGYQHQRVFDAGKPFWLCYALPNPDRGRPAVAVKQVRVSDLSGQQAGEEQFAKLIVHEHPQYQGPITLDVLPEEIGELPESEQYVSIEVIQPGERSGQRAFLSVDRFTKGNGSSWIFGPCLTCASVLRRVQHPGFSLVTSLPPAAT